MLLVGCGNDPPIEPELPAWDPTLPDARVIGSPRGFMPSRGIVHLHSPFSHDACDGNPRADDGTPNEPCLTDLRRALCTTRIDFAALTDHDDSMADEDFATLFSQRPGDEPLRDPAGDVVALRMICPEDAHVVTITVGSENDLMPIMLDRHVAGDVAQRHATYNGTDAASVAAFRDAGGLVWVAHTESKPLELLRAVEPDGIEVYNLHANIDPDIREEFLGLDGSAALVAAVEFADTNPGHPEPDLAMLAFLAPNAPAIETWNTLLGEGRRVSATAGSDAHQNAIPVTFGDGERGDSYRRVLRWFSNIAYATVPGDPVAVKDALRTGRMFALLEILGTPEGLDIRATSGATTFELGDVIPAGATITVDLPRIHALDERLPAPVIRARVVYIEAPTGVVSELGAAEGAGEQLVVTTPGPGAYRVELTMVPHHLAPYLRDLGPDLAGVELPWIYASPIYVAAP
jgi:hypothetical protein